ncbi:MAG: T9SS type A sorting domain-containing protein [candidate division Zixibacteria bacterium]|nr:T9SS type A sorting domain-containing protein [candidate division Zixibacteria bacterium]
MKNVGLFFLLLISIIILFSHQTLYANQNDYFVDELKTIKSGTGPLLQSLQEYRYTNEPFPIGLLLTRVGKQVTYDTPEGHFRIHFDTIGGHAVYEPDIDVDPADGYPDYVNRCAEYFEESWMLFDTLGYTMPPYDGQNGGGTDLYDVYMHHYAGAYGVTFPEDRSNQYPDRSNSYTSYIYVDPNYNGFGYPDRTLPLKVTVVHEFYHAVQFSYNLWADIWFMENSSTWSEDVLYDDVNDNYAYLSYFFNVPHYAHSTENGAHEYGMFVWPQYIFQNYGIDAMRIIWEETVYEAVDDALDIYFGSHGSTLQETYRDFIRWNYFTGSRDDQQHYEEGSHYPLIRMMETYNTLPVYQEASLRRPSGIGCNYIQFNNLGSFEGPFRFDVDGANSRSWAMDVIIFEEDGDIRYENTDCDPDGIGTIFVTTEEPVDNIVLIVSLLSNQTNQDYLYSAYIDSFTVVSGSASSAPEKFDILGNYPNPFNSSTVIKFISPFSSAINFKVFALSGREVHDSDHKISRGENSIHWDGEKLPSGIYYYKISGVDSRTVGRMTLLK